MRTASLFTLALLVCAAARGQSRPPADAPHAKLPQDQHGGLTISADAYSDAARAKDKFGKANPLPAGILAVEVFLRNDTSQIVRVKLKTIQLEVQFHDGTHQNVDSLSAREVAAAIAHPAGASSPSLPRIPIRIPDTGKDKKVDQLAEILSPLALDSDIVPPKGAIHGFVFFNMNHEMSLVPRSSLYVPDAMFVPENQPLMFFEVPLAGSAPAS
ncbi:MAG TPA: hypothetical protein VN661_06855 [Candidatus Acidoferrales bacterium]|nr:hypothetical protein [Candidatus Acidoferrales bacterium]